MDISLLQTDNGYAFTRCPRCDDVAEFINDTLMIGVECGSAHVNHTLHNTHNSCDDCEGWGYLACRTCCDIMIIDPIKAPRQTANTDDGSAQWCGYIASVLSIVPQFLYGFFATHQINQHNIIQFAKLINNVSHGRSICCASEFDTDLSCEIAKQMLKIGIYYCVSDDPADNCPAYDHFRAFDESRKNMLFYMMQRTTFNILPFEIRLYILDFCKIVVHKRDFREKYLMNLEIILCVPYFISATRTIFGNYDATESGPIYMRCLSMCGKGFTYRITGESLKNAI